MLSLRRSFGIVPAHRGIRTGGLYNVVRHPLYASELVWFLGFAIDNPSGWNIGLWLCDCVLQFSRACAEERFLSVDPIYSQYRTRVRYRLIRLSSFSFRLLFDCARKAAPHGPDDQIDEARRHVAAHQPSRRKLVGLRPPHRAENYVPERE